MRARRLIIGRCLAAMLSALILSGCSSVPNAVNPVEWYRGARDIVTGKDDDKTPPAKDTHLSAEADQPPPGADGPIPSVNTVPERPKVSSADDRDKVASSLVADQQGARRYSGEVIKRQGELPLPPPIQHATAAPTAQLPTPDQAARTQPAASSAPAPVQAQAQSAPGPTAEQVATAAPTPPPSMNSDAPASAPALATPATASAASRTPPQMRPVAAATPSAPPQAAGQPIRPANIVIPRENPTAPKLNEVKPYTPPAGMEDYETVYVTGAAGQGGEGRAAGPRRSLASAAATGATASASPAQSSRGSYQVATIQFTNGSSRLSDSDRRILAQVVAQQRQVGGTLRVVGHTAGRAESDDQVVSQARADVVAAELERLGATPDQVRTAGVGDSEPKYAETSPNGIAGNRRTEIFIDF